MERFKSKLAKVVAEVNELCNIPQDDVHNWRIGERCLNVILSDIEAKQGKRYIENFR